MALYKIVMFSLGEGGGEGAVGGFLHINNKCSTLKFLCDVCYNVIIIIPHYFMLHYRLIHINALKYCS